MPPKLALMLCTVFVLFLLRLERKQSPNVSRILWIPTIWMLLIASKPLGIWFGLTGSDMESGSPLDRYFLSMLLCLGLFILATRKFDWSGAIKKNHWVMLLVGYMFISIFWSDIPFISFKRWVRELIAIIMAFLLLTEQDPRQALLSLIKRTVYILIPFSVLLIKYFGKYGVMYGRYSGELMWIGVTQQKNGLGQLCFIAVFFLIWSLARRWQRRDIPVSKYQTYADVFVLIMALWLLKGPSGSYSATSIVTLAAGLAAFISFLWMKKHHINLGFNTLAAIMVFVIGMGIVAPMVGGSNVAGFASVLGREETLTGRTDVWAKLVPVAMRRPIMGYGFGAFWTPTTREVYNISGPHNGYLALLLELGFIGLLLLSMFLLSSGRKAQRELAYDYDWASLWICFLIMVVIHNISEASFSSLSSNLTAILVFLSISSTEANSLKKGA